MASERRCELKRLYCRFFDNGYCKYANDCVFNHNISESVRIPSNVCFFNLQSTCNMGSMCKFQHKNALDVYIDGGGILDYDTDGEEDEREEEEEEEEENFSNKNYDINSNNHNQLNLSTNSSFTLSSCSSSSSRSSKSSNDEIKNEKIKKNQLKQQQQQQSQQQIRSYAQVVRSDNDIDDISNKKICPYIQPCMHPDTCPYIHLEPCELCFAYCLNPYDKQQRDTHREDCIRQHEKDMEQAFAIQRSENKSCGICMDIILEKDQIIERRFGILEKCDHIFCLPCIRKWRKTEQLDKKTVRSCPECRIYSGFVIPSKFWYDSSEEKKKFIDDYKKVLSEKPCRHFKSGEGNCPFGSACFYLHAYPDGTIADKTTPRRLEGEDGVNKQLEIAILAQYFEETYFLSDDEDYWVTYET